jgi:hypothetical protein
MRATAYEEAVPYEGDYDPTSGDEYQRHHRQLTIGKHERKLTSKQPPRATRTIPPFDKELIETLLKLPMTLG